MDFSKINGKIYLNKKFLDSNKAKIHVLNHSLHFASSVFEGIRVYNKKILFLDDHLKRLIKSSKIMGLNLNYSLKELTKLNYLIVKKNKINDGYIRPLVFRSSHSMSPETKKCFTQLALAAWKWKVLFSNSYGIKLNLSKYPKLNSKIYPIGAKSSGSYQTSVISKIDSEKKNYDDCLMLDLKGNVAETTACNIFWIRNNIVYTSKKHSILDGITRQAILEFCRLKKIKVIIGDFKLSHIVKSDCVFVTGTAAEIQFVKSINKYKFKKNRIFYELQNYYYILKDNPPLRILDIKNLI
jgi:branched-chain amino acid aminotransferase